MRANISLFWKKPYKHWDLNHIHVLIRRNKTRSLRKKVVFEPKVGFQKKNHTINELSKGVKIVYNNIS